MEYKRKIETGPIMKDSEGSEIGHYYKITEIWGGKFNGATDYEWWEIHPDGVFMHAYDSDAERYCWSIEGTFDASKYDNIIKRMDNLETGWMNEMVCNPDSEMAVCG